MSGPGAGSGGGSAGGDGYFEGLAAALRAGGVAEREVAVTVADLRAYLAETGSTAEEEFGPVEVFAARLTGRADSDGDGGESGGDLGDGPGGPEAGAETWTWTTDIYNDRRLLGLHGAQGWEVERLDRLGRFVCRRPVGTALRWEYRREVLLDRERGAVEAELAPDGWEPCGRWTYYLYFKRPGAASTGPAATVVAPPARPRRGFYTGRKARVLLGTGAVSTALVALLLGSGAVEFHAAVFVPAAVVGAIAAWAGLRRDIVNGTEDDRAASGDTA
ncbi:hypothetical protein OG875_07555 [Streptomyces sp. NBC_01498]|uniref:hypothetical protein n=1 Tax=Streptomyces sp. NBC_01498 TaxID=2975870 RepID=UPI002E7BAD15|nr:hypothetical protein [Streptomyces sp. NBC_01498]WTL24468.1 hypothetical protein OG875_07555 [Streptomyces sp. NBC_01498]